MERAMPATERLYYTDAYLRLFEAEVVAASGDGRTVYLDRSAFYPASGGQPFDRGWLGGATVEEVRDEGSLVAHLLATPINCAPGQNMRGEVDWTRRYDFMQQHTGQHLLSAAIEEMFGYSTVSVHLGDESSTIELSAAALTADQIKQTEERCLDLVALAKPVAVSFEDGSTVTGLRKASERQGTLRIISIQGVDRSACGGTHVRSLAEIGFVAVRRLEKVRGNVRLEFAAGQRALRRARLDYRLLAEMSKTCSVAVDDLDRYVATLHQRAADAEKRAQRLAVEAARQEGAQLFQKTPPGTDGVRRLWFTTPAIGEAERMTAQAFVEQGKGIALILGTNQNTVLVACGAETRVDAGAVLKQAIAETGGKGGGSAAMAQGSLASMDGLAALKRILGMAPA